MTKIERSQLVLKYTYGLVVLAIGVDKLLRTDIIANWDTYISPLVSSLLPFNTSTFLIIVASIEIAVGILLLTKWTRIFAYISAFWLLLISINLLMLGLVDIAARDMVLAVGAITLAWLTEYIEVQK